MALAAEVDQTMKRIQAHKGIIGTIIINAEGQPVKSTLDNTTSVQYASIMMHICEKTRSIVRDLDPTNDLTFLRIRTKKTEVMVAPEKDFMIIVIQSSAE